MDNTSFQGVDISGTNFTGSVLTNGELDGSWRRSNPPIGWPTGVFEFND